MADNDVFERIEPLLADSKVNEIMINGYDSIYVDRGDNIVQVEETVFENDDQIVAFIRQLAESLGRRIDEASPIVDLLLSDGTRIHAVIPPIAKQPAVVMRKLFPEAFSPERLIEFGSWTEEMVNFMRAVIEGRLNVLVAGGTGSGKTTMLRIFTEMIPAEERIIAVEQLPEKIRHPHLVHLRVRPGNLDGEGGIGATKLLQSALKMRPDRIILTESHGGEVLHFLQAMNTGHDGSMTSIHATSPQDALARFETMAMMADPGTPLTTLRRQIADAVDVITQQERGYDGRRRITRITEVTGIQNDIITTQDLFRWDEEHGFYATGNVPGFLDRLQRMGIDLPAGLFQSD